MFENDDDVDVDDEFLNIVFESEERDNNNKPLKNKLLISSKSSTDITVELSTPSALRKCVRNTKDQSDTNESFHARHDLSSTSSTTEKRFPEFSHVNNSHQLGRSFALDWNHTFTGQSSVKRDQSLGSNNVGDKENKRKASSPPPRLKRERKFPGPAGLLPDRRPSRGTPLRPDSLPVVESPSASTSDELCSQGRLSGSVLEGGPWQSLVSDLGPHAEVLDVVNVASVKRKAAARCFVGKKVPLLAAALHHLDVSSADPCVILRDSTGEIHGTLHREVWQQFAAELVVGSVLVVRNVGLLSTGFSCRRHYLNSLIATAAGEIHGTLHREVWQQFAAELVVGSVLVVRNVGLLSTGFSCRRHYLNSLIATAAGEIHGTLHREVWQQFAAELVVGSVLVVRNVGLLSTGLSCRRHYLNITANNLATIYSANPDKPQKRELHSLTSHDYQRTIEHWQSLVPAPRAVGSPASSLFNTSLPSCSSSPAQSPQMLSVRPSFSGPIHTGIPHASHTRPTTSQNTRGYGSLTGTPPYPRANQPPRLTGKKLFPSCSNSNNQNTVQTLNSNSISQSASRPQGGIVNKTNPNIGRGTFNNSFLSHSVQKPYARNMQNVHMTKDSAPSFKFDPVIMKTNTSNGAVTPNHLIQQSTSRNEFGKHCENSFGNNSPKITLSQSSQLTVEEQSVVDSVFDGIDADSLFDDDDF